MPLLKGTFRPTTTVARSRTNSQSEGELRSRSNSFSEYQTSGQNSIKNTTLPQSQFSAFKVPATPIVVGLASPKKPPSSPLFHASPRKTPTTPFIALRPASPHFIPFPVEVEPTRPDFLPLKEVEAEEVIPEKVGEEEVVDVVSKQSLEAVIKADKEDSDYPDSDLQSVTSYPGSEGSFSSTSSRKRKKKQVIIDKSLMTIRDVIKLKTPRCGTDNPLTQIWKELKNKEKRDKKLDAAKEESKKNRIQQLIEEARDRGEILTENDIDEDELPPIEVEIDPATGKIIVNQASLEIKMASETGDIRETVVEDEGEVTYGKYEDHKVSIMSYSRRKQRKTVKWSERENERFYLALRKVGTDFDLMARLMPEYSRDDLKRKFKREEKLRLSKVDMALNYSLKLDDTQLERAASPPKDLETKKKRKGNGARISARETEDLTTVMNQMKPLKREKRKSTRKSVKVVLSDSEDEDQYRPTSRRSRPLVIDDDDAFMIRDDSIDRKILL